MSTSTRAGWLLLFSAGLLAPAAHAGHVRVVGPLGTAPFLDIQTAIDVSVDGDIVLVKAGTFAAFTIVNKRIHVVADAGQSVTILGTVQVTGLDVSRDVVLAGLTVQGALRGLELMNDAGSVRIQSCTFNGANMIAPFPHAVVVDGCDDVDFVGCTLLGSLHWANSGAGLRATNSTIALHDCVLRGGEGRDSNCAFQVDGGNGGDGVWVTDSFLFASGTSFRGGDGGRGGQNCGESTNGGNGGHGIHLEGTGTGCRLLDCSFVGSLGGGSGCGISCGQAGLNGLASYVHGGAGLAIFSETRRKLVVPAVVRELPATLPLTILGQPGDIVSLLISRQTDFTFVQNQYGVRLLPLLPAPTVISLGTVPAGGTLSISIPSFPMGAGVEGRVYFLQTQHRLPNGTRMLGSPGNLVVLDSSF